MTCSNICGMNKALLFANLLFFSLLGCKNDPKTTDPNQPPSHIQPGEKANPNVLAGHWIALDFCAYSNQYGSVLKAMNNAHKPYAYAFTFIPTKPDSIICYNGFETWTLPVKINVDTITLEGARPGKNIFLIYHSEGEKDITMIDPTNSQVQIDRFIKSKASVQDAAGAFTTALNHHVFNGVFTPIGKGATDKVMFNPTGELQGIKGFNRYQICSAGDCFLAGQDIDVVSFSAKDKPENVKYYGYRYNNNTDTLTLFNLVNTNPEEKGAYKVAAPAFKFARKRGQ